MNLGASSIARRLPLGSACTAPAPGFGLRWPRWACPPATRSNHLLRRSTSMDEIQLLRTLDPVTAEKVDAFPAPKVFEQLSAQLAEVPAGASSTARPRGCPATA